MDPHDWGPHETIREESFGVAMGCRQVCKRCGAVRYEDWSETRSSGGTPRIADAGDGSCNKRNQTKKSS